MIPAEATATLNFRYAPEPHAGRGRARGCASSSPAGELAIPGNSPAAHVALDTPLVERLLELGGFAVEPKQAWTPVARVLGARPRRGQLRPGRAALRAPRDEQVAVAALERTFEALRPVPGGSVESMHLSPALARMARTRSCGSRRRSARPRAPGVELIDFGMGDPNEPTEPFIRQALVDGAAPRLGYPRAPGCRSCARRSRAGATAASASSSTPTRRSCRRSAEGGDLLASPRSLVDRGADGRRRRHASPAYPVYERGAPSPAREVVPLPLLEANGFLPDLDAVDRDDVGARRDPLGQLPEQPDRRGRAARRSSSELAARARRARLLLCSDEAYTELWFDEPPRSALAGRATARERRRLQHALEALVDDRLPLRLRRRRRRT